MKCWICSRQARGFLCTDKRYPYGAAARYPLDWVFCSQRCQHIFHQLYQNWTEALATGLSAEASVTDFTRLEHSAMRSCLKPFGTTASVIGFGKPLGAYSEEEALLIINAIVNAYVAEMATQHERCKYPPVRLHDAMPISDPISSPIYSSTPTHPFADLEDDLP